uniref:D-isomer specific 2-hydroxyacid dehydrogenase NAD-binding domain-containing protein n=1 Tax=Spumella elongata TaxID=89044 RepID=A0A7S3M4X6_9STRA
MNVIVVTRSGLSLDSNEGTKNERETGFVRFIAATEMSFYEGVKLADTFFVCCSQNAENMGFVNKNFIAQLKPGVLIVNVARGGMVNYDDVYDGLLSGAVGGLGTDVFSPEPFPLDAPILSHQNVIATPHIAGVTEVSYRNMAQKVAENVERIMLGEAPVDAVNDVAAFRR